MKRPVVESNQLCGSKLSAITTPLTPGITSAAPTRFGKVPAVTSIRAVASIPTIRVLVWLTRVAENSLEPAKFLKVPALAQAVPN